MGQLRRLFTSNPKPETAPESKLDSLPQPTPDTAAPDSLGAQIAALTETVAALEKTISRAAKEQLKSNMLAEDALAEAKTAVSVARTALDRLNSGSAPQAVSERSISDERPSQLRSPLASANTRLLEAFMPILDRIEAGLQSGTAQLERLPDDPYREILAGWLDGQRLLRERILALFEKENVRSITTIGQPFDPYRHVAVETLNDPSHPPGTIIEERRRGYEIGQRVLRFAEVVVSSAKPT